MKRLRAVADVDVIDDAILWRKERLLEIIGNYEGVIIAVPPFDREIIARANRLKVISRRGVGYDNVDLKAAKGYMARYYNRYQGVTKYRDAMIEMARKKGYVSTLFNRRRYLPDIQHSNRVIRSEAERMAINTPIQGTSADLIKKAMINIYQRLNKEGFESKMLLQVHDELVFEVPVQELDTVIPMIREEMEGVCTLAVPLKVDIRKGRNWGEAH